MNGWDVVITIINQFPPVAMTLLLIAIIVAVVIGIAGFSRHGMDFVKHGFQQNVLDELLDKLATKTDIEELRLATKEDMEKLRGEFKTDIEGLRVSTKEDIKQAVDGLRTEVKADINRLETRIDKMETRFEKVETRMGGMEAELATIKVNHFGHLKNFLTELTSIMLDKKIIEYTDKARLDNQLSGM